MFQAALILEGGALRGQFTAGVLDAFLAADVQFKTVIGVSAGALCGTNYVSRQAGRTNLINTHYRNDKNYISLRRALRRQDIINLDYLFAEHGGDWVDFDERAYRTSLTEFIVVATSLETGRGAYFRSPQGADLVATLKASSAMPFISRPSVTAQGLCLDGGIADSIPYAYAKVLGYDKIVVIRTRERAYRKSKTSRVLASAYARRFAEYPAFVESAIHRPEMYNHQADTLETMEQAGECFVIAPAEPVTVSRLERDVSKLTALYETGVATGNAQLAAMRTYLGD